MRFKKNLITVIFIIFITGITASSNDAGVSINVSVLPQKIWSSKPEMSPDGEKYALIGDDSVHIYNADGRKLGTFIDPSPYINPPNEFKFWNPNREISAVAFLPDSKHLAVAVYQRTVHIITLDGKILRTIKVPRKKMSAASGGWSYIRKIVYFPDGKRLITFEPTDIDVVVRDSNYKMIKRINLMNGPMGFAISDIKITPDGKYFVTLQDYQSPSKDGWSSVIRMYNKNGVFIKDLETDKPVRIKTQDGRLQRAFIKPGILRMSSDGKNIVYFARTNIKDPLGRTFEYRSSKRTLRVEYKIRKISLHGSDHYETWVTNKTNISLKDVFLSKNGKYYIVLGNNNIYHLSLNGKVLKTIKYPEVDYISSGKLRKSQLSLSYHELNQKSENVVSLPSLSGRAAVVIDLDGKLKSIVRTNNLVPKRVYVSKNGEHISFELERAKKTYLFNSSDNKISTENASIYYSLKNKIIKLGIEKKGYKKVPYILNRYGKQLYPEYKSHLLMLFPNEKFAELSKSFTLFKGNGDAIRRYPNVYVDNSTVFHPDLKYYIFANTSAKYKTVILKNLQGRKIKEWYLGAFFTSSYSISSNGLRIAAGHDKAGYVQVWNQNGKLLKRISHIHSPEILATAITGDNRFVLSSDYSGKTVVYDLKTDKYLSIYLFPDEKFAAYDSEGRYDCSDELNDLVIVNKNGEAVTGFRKRAYREKNLVEKFFKGK